MVPDGAALMFDAAYVAFGFLVILAATDLWVGVANDAVNFINSAVGARVATVRQILLVAVGGVAMGALLSGGMMEIARKGIFDPGLFYGADGKLDVSAVLGIYLAVMVTDVVLLDAFNTFGLPTSTTVSLVSALLGASLATVYWHAGGDLSAVAETMELAAVGNMYVAILASVVISLATSAAVMFLARLLYGFRLHETYGATGWLWTGLSATSTLYFLVFKGLKHAAFLTPAMKVGLDAWTWPALGAVFVTTAVVSAVLRRHHETVLRALVLAGTMALAMAFAGNDLVNFIGPTVAAGYAVLVPGVDLTSELGSPTLALLGAGAVMGAALWFSKKARTVTDTEVRLATQGETEERFRSNAVARGLVAVSVGAFNRLASLLPERARAYVADRTDPRHRPNGAPPYDLLRASVNLTVSTALIALGTAQKLPLSTTYVTFMVAMGAALADRGWSGASADRRVAGVLAVILGWLVTALVALVASMTFGTVAYFAGPGPSTAIFAAVVVGAFVALHRIHERRMAGKTGAVAEALAAESLRRPPTRPSTASDAAPSG